MADIYPDIQGQSPVAISLSAPLLALPGGETFTQGQSPSLFQVPVENPAGLSTSAPVGQHEILGSPYIYDIYLAYLTFECPALPTYGGYGQLFPWTGVVPGTDGKNIELRRTTTSIQWSQAGTDNWLDLVPLSGITGPAGAPAYVHQQSTPATTWTINHNLGYRPSVEVFDSGSSEMIAEIVHPTVNQALVNVNPASAGFARLI